MLFIGAKNNSARDKGINFSEKFCGGVKHLNTSNSVATRQCSSELGIVLAAPSFLLRGIPIGVKRKKEDLEYLAVINYEILE